MADDPPFYTPNVGPAPKPASKSGESIWSVRHDHATWSYELRFHGESYGWEAQILRDGELVLGRRFVLREQAITWSEGERDAIEKGWR